jgi:hypothetical protein
MPCQTFSHPWLFIMRIFYKLLLPALCTTLTKRAFHTQYTNMRAVEILSQSRETQKITSKTKEMYNPTTQKPLSERTSKTFISAVICFPQKQKVPTTISLSAQIAKSLHQIKADKLPVCTRSWIQSKRGPPLTQTSQHWTSFVRETGFIVSTRSRSDN